MTITLKPHSGEDNTEENKKLRSDLQNLINKPENEQKIAAMVGYMTTGTDGLPIKKDYPTRWELVMAYARDLHTSSESYEKSKTVCDHNLCTAIFDVSKTTKTDKQIPEAIRAGIQSVASAIVNLARMSMIEGSLKREILAAASTHNINEGRGGVV